jgi:hypothetical protein
MRKCKLLKIQQTIKYQNSKFTMPASQVYSDTTMIIPDKNDVAKR